MQEPTEIGAAGDAYLKALRLRRIDTDVRYYDPTRPPPALDTEVTPPKTDSDDDDRAQGPGRLPLAAALALILIGIAFLFLRYGGGLSVSFARERDNAGQGARAHANVGSGISKPMNISAILATTDRRAALISLTATALARAIEAQGLLFQKSWTARDILRHLPATAPFRDELKALVFASERVHFGGRDVSEDEFRTHVTRIRPLVEKGGA